MIRNRIQSQGQDAAPGKRFYFMRAWSLILIIFLALGFVLPEKVWARDDDTLLVLPPDTSAFPLLLTQVKPTLFPGMTISDLESSRLIVLENGQAVDVVDFEKQSGGVHFTLAINGDRYFDVHNDNGETPYDRIRLTFENWLSIHPFSPKDSLSLVTPEGSLIQNSMDHGAWMEALINYQPDFRGMVPDLNCIETAIHLAAERVVPFGANKTLLYITSPPSPEEIDSLRALTEVVQSAGIQVSVWMLGEEFFMNNDQGKVLFNLAAATGGEFFHYTGVETFPSPESSIQDLGVYYDLTFASRIRQEGTYSIVVKSEDGKLRGESSAFYLNVQPPKPILLSPPTSISRSAPLVWDGDLKTLEPTSLLIEFILEFPDGYHRELSISRLYLDGQVVDERRQEPFTLLNWDLTLLEEPDEHILQVEVEDSLGLTGKTIQTPIQVVLNLPEPEPEKTIQQVGMVIVWVILAAAGLVAIIWGVRYFFTSASVHQIFKKSFEFQRKLQVEASSGGDHQKQPLANLLPLTSGAMDWKQSAIPITDRHTIIGNTPDHANLILTAEDIENVHACLHVTGDVFWLSDCGSAAGTWINYSPIGDQPVQLLPGDLIHIGSTGFRFTIIDMESPPEATVENYELFL